MRPQTVPEEEWRSIAGVIVSDDAEIGGLQEVWLPGGPFLKKMQTDLYLPIDSD